MFGSEAKFSPLNKLTKIKMHELLKFYKKNCNSINIQTWFFRYESTL